MTEARTFDKNSDVKSQSESKAEHTVMYRYLVLEEHETGMGAIN